MSVIVDFFKAVAGICKTVPLSPDLWNISGAKARIKIGQVAELQSPGGAVYLKGKELTTPILIVRKQDGGFLCAENRCTHMGRKLDPVRGQEVIRCCSVSHSTFDFKGLVSRGPARKPLSLLRSRVENGDLVIEL